MNRKILQIDAEIARLRGVVLQTQKQIESLAEDRGRALAALEKDTSFIRKTRGGVTRSPTGGG